MIGQGTSIGFRSLRASRLPHLDRLLEARTCYLLPGMACGVDAVGGWGRKSRSRSAQALAERRGLPFFLVEDGFLRSLERDDPPLSIVIDDFGIYYDATTASRLEMLIAEPLSADETARARSLIAAWRAARVSKYNHAREHRGALPANYVLVCDQTYGDASIHFGRRGRKVSSACCRLRWRNTRMQPCWSRPTRMSSRARSRAIWGRRCWPKISGCWSPETAVTLCPCLSMRRLSIR